MDVLTINNRLALLFLLLTFVSTVASEVLGEVDVSGSGVDEGSHHYAGSGNLKQSHHEYSDIRDHAKTNPYSPTSGKLKPDHHTSNVGSGSGDHEGTHTHTSTSDTLKPNHHGYKKSDFAKENPGSPKEPIGSNEELSGSAEESSGSIEEPTGSPEQPSEFAAKDIGPTDESFGSIKGASRSLEKGSVLIGGKGVIFGTTSTVPRSANIKKTTVIPVEGGVAVATRAEIKTTKLIPVSQSSTETDGKVTKKLNLLIEEEGTEIYEPEQKLIQTPATLPTTVYPKNKLKYTTRTSFAHTPEILIKKGFPTPDFTTTSNTEVVSEPTTLTTEKASQKTPTTFRSFIRNIKKELGEVLAWKKEHEKKLHKIAMYIADVFKQESSGEAPNKTKKKYSPRHGRMRRSNKKHENGLSKEIQRKIEDHFPCRDPKTLVPIKSGTSFFNQQQCLQCQCNMGELSCKKDLKKCFPNSCHLMNGEVVPNLVVHNDGCNNCLCDFGNLICTRLRCADAGHSYTNYKLNGVDDAEPEKLFNSRLQSEKPSRIPDICLECDHLPGPYVCGVRQWKTFPSLCHALYCGENQNEDIYENTCENLDPCTFAACKEDEKCVVYNQTPCLAGRKTTSMCTQYKCIPRNLVCSGQSTTDVMVCGVDGKTYSSECELFSKGTQLAYKGPCKKRCNFEVCGIESRTIPTRCHASETMSYIDYFGPCEYHFTTPLIWEDSNGEMSYNNQRCDLVYENERCRPLKCQTVVVPPGACCPVCGAALVVSVNSSNTTPIRLNEVQQFLLSIQHEVSQQLCKVAIDLTYTMDIVVVLQPYKINRLSACDDMAEEIVDTINFERENVNKGVLAFLGSATMVKKKQLETMDGDLKM